MRTLSDAPKALSPTVTAYLPGAIAWWRHQRGLTQAELARKAGVSRSEIKWLERGRKNGPRTDTLELLCQALEITLMELIARAEAQMYRLSGRVPVMA